MHLVNFPKVRIRKHPNGFVVEVQKETWPGLSKRWVHIESVSGIESEPWYYSSFEAALDQVVKHFKWDVIENSL